MKICLFITLMKNSISLSNTNTDGVVAMVRPVHSKRKLFNNAKEHKENTTPDEHLEELPRLDETQQGESNKSLHCQLSQQFCPQDNKTHLNRPLPVISTSSETSSKTSNKTSKQNFAGKSTRPWVEDEEASCAAVGGTPARPRHAMPMSERQQIALLLQMSSPSSTKFIPESSSPSPRCYSPYCDPSDPGTPQSSGMLAGGVATPSGGGRGAATPSAGGGRGTATPSAGGGRAAGVGKRNERGETPLHVAAIRGDVERVQQLIARGSDVNAVDYAGKFWSTPRISPNEVH
ncbi:ankyrin repeat domain-containing protein 12 isoform X2 [Hyalella azteca]|uniref:Ankyrin repeat domain-containing protein 12 isoform X2 n=1 Tax=Hyalella azteca TaxID=294128 RepID=A0A979FX82_HYAAZ|nr:ankyrin repeat domain-containing protein 12 isoform X2 [Hyalella azteca]